MAERIGSSKIVRSGPAVGQILLTDSGATSVFDVGAIEGFVSLRLAIARTTQVVSIFKYLERLGVPTHFVGQVDPTTIMVKESKINDLPLLSGECDSRHLNLEFLFRLRISRKFYDRIERGETEAVFVDDGIIKPGAHLMVPYVEVSTKWEPTDRYVKRDEAALIAHMAPERLDSLYDELKNWAVYIEELLRQIGLDTDDGKIEMARCFDAPISRIIDVLSLDELGARRGDQHHGKNLIRDYYKSNEQEWYESLVQAKAEYPADKTKWPKCPPLPLELQELHVSRYEVAAHLLAEAVEDLR